MAKRIKSDKQTLPVRDWTQADDFLRQIGDIQLKIKKHEIKANETINAARAELTKTTGPLVEKIIVLTDSLESFAANHTDDFGKAQSRKLTFGQLGWRKSTVVLIKKTTLGLLHKVFKGNAPAFLRFKEDVDKEALQSLTDEQLASVDARRKNKEPFFVEPDLTLIADYETAE
jgi:phage host-nuclease inhibitor protein Gam